MFQLNHGILLGMIFFFLPYDSSLSQSTLPVIIGRFPAWRLGVSGIFLEDVQSSRSTE